MKTDELIDMLGTNLEPARTGQLRSALAIALTVGAAAAFCLMLAIYGMPADVMGGESFGLKLLALAFALGVVACGAVFLIRSARPGSPGRRPPVLIGLACIIVLAAACLMVLVTQPSARGGDMIFGPQWAACLICIPVFAVAPFLSLIWALRQGAPTNLRHAGALAGLVAGGLGAAVYALHQSGGSIPFVLIWYGGIIALCALVGALLGPRLLRW